MFKTGVLQTSAKNVEATKGENRDSNEMGLSQFNLTGEL